MLTRLTTSGGNFARFTLPVDAQTLLDNIAAGDRWIIALARPSPVPVNHTADAGDISWTFAVSQPTVTYQVPRDHTVDAGDISWTFAVSEPTATYDPGPESFVADAGDVSWRFAVSEPTVTYARVARVHTADAGDVAWTFAVSGPTVAYLEQVTVVRQFDSIQADPYTTDEELAMEYWAALPFSQIDVAAYKDILNPFRCPLPFLAELADLLQAYTWAPFMPEAYQRQAVADWWYYYRYRTSEAALQRWMSEIESLYSLRWVEGGNPLRKTELTINMSDTPLVAVDTNVRQWEIDTVRRILGWPFMIDPINVIFSRIYRTTVFIGMGMTIKHFKGW